MVGPVAKYSPTALNSKASQAMTGRTGNGFLPAHEQLISGVLKLVKTFPSAESTEGRSNSGASEFNQIRKSACTLVTSAPSIAGTGPPRPEIMSPGGAVVLLSSNW